MSLLGADIGGTKVNLALFDWEQGSLVCRRKHSYHRREYDDLNARNAWPFCWTRCPFVSYSMRRRP